jgi:hypothetical protein
MERALLQTLLRPSDRQSSAVDRALAEALLSGGNSRLALDPRTLLNKYGTSPWPRPAELSFSSSTASTISEEAYAAAHTLFVRLGKAIDAAARERLFQDCVEEARQEIKAQFELPSNVGVVLSPSGTDSELHALFLARQVLRGPVAAVIVAAEETGSGTGLAAAGRHFDGVTSAGSRVVKGEPVEGLAAEAPNRDIRARGDDGAPRSMQDVDQDVLQSLQQMRRAGLKMVLHVMDHSKTGLSYPSDACIDTIRSRYRSDVQIVVDACQTRLSRARLRRYLDRDCIVLVTGSKFFAGPAFSGALLVPAGIAGRIFKIAAVPAGLADYSSRDDWPAEWAFRSQLPARTNAGQLLRWIAALEEIRAYHAVPELFRKLALQEFGNVVRRSVSRHPALRLLTVAERENVPSGDEFDSPTIFSILVEHNGRCLGLERSATLFGALNEDVSALVPGSERQLAATPCHIGQPVAVANGSDGVAGVLRLSLDARAVSRSWSGGASVSATEKMQDVARQLRTVVDKIALLADHFDRIET